MLTVVSLAFITVAALYASPTAADTAGSYACEARYRCGPRVSRPLFDADYLAALGTLIDDRNAADGVLILAENLDWGARFAAALLSGCHRPRRVAIKGASCDGSASAVAFMRAYTQCMGNASAVVARPCTEIRADEPFSVCCASLPFTNALLDSFFASTNSRSGVTVVDSRVHRVLYLQEVVGLMDAATDRFIMHDTAMLPCQGHSSAEILRDRPAWREEMTFTFYGGFSVFTRSALLSEAVAAARSASRAAAGPSHVVLWSPPRTNVVHSWAGGSLHPMARYLVTAAGFPLAPNIPLLFNLVVEAWRTLFLGCHPALGLLAHIASCEGGLRGVAERKPLMYPDSIACTMPGPLTDVEPLLFAASPHVRDELIELVVVSLDWAAAQRLVDGRTWTLIETNASTVVLLGHLAVAMDWWVALNASASGYRVSSVFDTGVGMVVLRAGWVFDDATYGDFLRQSRAMLRMRRREQSFDWTAYHGEIDKRGALARVEPVDALPPCEGNLIRKVHALPPPPGVAARVLCVQYSTPDRADRVVESYALWGHRCDGFLAYTSAPAAPFLSEHGKQRLNASQVVVIEVPGGEDYYHVWRKVQVIVQDLALRLVPSNKYVRHRSAAAYDYVAFGGDDMFIIPNNLRWAVASPDVARRHAEGLPVYLGCKLFHHETPFCQGGMYAYNLKALSLLIDIVVELPWEFSLQKSPDEDRYIGELLDAKGVVCEGVVDEHGQDIVNMWNPFILQTHAMTKDFHWFHSYRNPMGTLNASRPDYRFVARGMTSISYRSASLHYMVPQAMRNFDLHLRQTSPRDWA